MTIRDAASRLKGIHAATVVPLAKDLSVDTGSLESYTRWISNVIGIGGLLINGHAGENFLLSRAEKAQVVEVTHASAAEGCFIVAGINSENSVEAAEQAQDAERLGADAILVFPPNSWALSQDPDVVKRHHAHIESACGLPILLYQAPVGAGQMAYRQPVLAALIESPRVIGIKEGSWEVAAYEENRRFVHERRPDIAVLGSGDEHLLTSYLIGTEGSQVSLATVVPDLIVELFAAASLGDWAAARMLHERIYPLAVAIYRRKPGNRATARLKTCLKLIGRLPSDRVRPPSVETPQNEIAELEDALARAVATKPAVGSRKSRTE